MVWSRFKKKCPITATSSLCLCLCQNMVFSLNANIYLVICEAKAHSSPDAKYLQKYCKFWYFAKNESL